MAFEIEDSDLWKKSLAYRDGDANAEARTALRNAILKMRSMVSSLVTEIPADCRGLTIHDITHLDALWEMADLIAGEDYDLNPVEAFVFGASVLLHDSALTFIAYPGGLDELKKTTIWKDLEAASKRQADIDASGKGIDYDEIAFGVLRSLHAHQAENLATQSWPVGAKGDRVYLLEDSDLRMSYARSIGRIAHSHHWGIDRVADELRDDIGASPSLPKEWTLSERKIACLLRCADIAHMDRRRAPTILLAAKSLSENSKPHWQFQNKINKPVIREDALFYSSGESFSLEENESWWLAYDTLRAVDLEIRNSNALLSEQRFPKFSAQRVAGTESPRGLARLITTDGWRPVDTEIRVTDPAHLARTLGGANLYGNDKIAPIRELIQNAVDAVRARRSFENRPSSWGHVIVSVDVDNNGDAWLIVDDNGIGMSERVLTGPLIDFGNSFWNSSVLQEEFPGLQSEGISPVGKFGIGFFSVFLLGDQVSVSTSKVRSSDNLKTLEFSGLGRRPVLRDADPSEVRLDFTTRVKVKLHSNDVLSKMVAVSDRNIREITQEVTAINAVKSLVSCVDVNIDVVDSVYGAEFSHSYNWLSSDAEEFLDESNSDVRNVEDVQFIANIHSQMMEVIEGDDGQIYGRASLNLIPGERGTEQFSRLSVGGFVNLQARNGFNYYIGTLAAKTNVASRASAVVDVPLGALSRWATSQAKKLDKDRLHPVDQLKICHNVVRIGGDPGALPFCLGSNGLETVSAFRARLESLKSIIVPVVLSDKDYRSSESKSFEYVSIAKLANQILFYKLKSDCIVMADSDLDLFYDDPDEIDINKSLSECGEYRFEQDDLYFRSEFQALTLELERVWGEYRIRLVPEDFIDMKVYRDNEEMWALRFERFDV